MTPTDINAFKKCGCLFYLPITIVLFSSCVTPGETFVKKNEDEAIQILTQKLLKYPNDHKYATNLVNVYQQANQKSYDKIALLSKENQVDSWEQIFGEYMNIDKRQEAVRAVTPLTINGQVHHLPMYDVNREIIEIKARIAEHYYTHAKQILLANDRNLCQKAYSEFLKVRQYSTMYPDLEQLQEEAREKGTYHILLVARNNSAFLLSDDYLKNNVKPELLNLDTNWMKYHIQAEDRNDYDYTIVIELRDIKITPAKTTNIAHNESKTIAVGCNNRFDLITCSLEETYQEKSVRIDGSIIFMRGSPQSIFMTTPFVAEYLFEFSSYVAEGDKSLLPGKLQELIKTYPQPKSFPSDLEMINGVAKNLKSIITDIILTNRLL